MGTKAPARSNSSIKLHLPISETLAQKADENLQPEIASERKSLAFHRVKEKKNCFENILRQNQVVKKEVLSPEREHLSTKDVESIEQDRRTKYASFHLKQDYKISLKEEESVPPVSFDEDLPNAPLMRVLSEKHFLTNAETNQTRSPRVKTMMENIFTAKKDKQSVERIEFPYSSNSAPSKPTKNRLFDMRDVTPVRSENIFSYNSQAKDYSTPFVLSPVGYHSTPRKEEEIPTILSSLSQSVNFLKYSSPSPSPRIEENPLNNRRHAYTANKASPTLKLAQSVQNYCESHASPRNFFENGNPSTSSSSSTKPNFKKNLTEKLNNIRIVSTVVKTEEIVFKGLLNDIGISTGYK